jgi:hypothetical protein
MSNLTENRINRILDETAMTNALAAISNLETELPEGSLDDEQRQNFRAINVQNKVFTEDVMIEMENNGATILPPYLNVALLKNDFDLFEQLDTLESRMLNAVRKITDLKRIAGHEAYSFALSVYKSYDAANQAGIPGAKESYERLSERFNGQGRTNEIEEETP